MSDPYPDGHVFRNDQGDPTAMVQGSTVRPIVKWSATAKGENDRYFLHDPASASIEPFQDTRPAQSDGSGGNSLRQTLESAATK